MLLWPETFFQTFSFSYQNILGFNSVEQKKKKPRFFVPSMKLGYYHHCSTLQQSNLTISPSTIRLPRSCVGTDSSTAANQAKIIVIVGATGSGKSRLSVDLATRFFPAEIINSDKMQLYRGLDITTNKIPVQDRRGIPHHLLGEFDSELGELSPSDYRSIGASTIQDIVSRGGVPVVVGGSNSLVHALVTDQFDPKLDVFDNPNLISPELRYNCCFIWVDVAMPVLYEYLLRRVDDMFDVGMLDELAEFFELETESTDSVDPPVGIRKAIGVPEFKKYFRYFLPNGNGCGVTMDTQLKMDVAKRVILKEAVDAIKYNTCQLAKRQVGKILQLESAGWNLQRLDATEVFRAVLSSRRAKFWKEEMLDPSIKIVHKFLEL